MDLTTTQTAIDCLNYISIQKGDYDKWLKIGAGLKTVGASCADWDNWSKTQVGYSAGICENKWKTFNSTKTGIGSLVMYAKENGYKPTTKKINTKKETKDLQQDTKIFLNTLFNKNETFCVCAIPTIDDKGKYIPSNKGVHFTIDRFLKHLKTAKERNLNTYDDNAGVWFRVNPTDGKGANDSNITEYKYVLVESDELSIEKQDSLLRKLNLPIATLTYSGSKSLHAIVKIDAGKDLALYKQRVNFLFTLLETEGFDIDKGNKNPSRLSRLAGFKRGKQQQSLIATNIGAKNYNEWEKNLVVSKAKTLNKISLQNHIIDFTYDDNGNEKVIKIPKAINEIYAEFKERFLGFPYKLGDTLFDWDKKTKDIYYIYDSTCLFAWIAEKSNNPVMWSNQIQGCVTKQEFFKYLLKIAPNYESVSFIPDYPIRKNVFYAPIEMPKASKHHDYFETFVGFFNPATAHDKILLKCMIAAPIYYKYGIPRPLWIVDAVHAQSSGKTTLIELIAELYGTTEDTKSVIDLDYNDLKKDSNEFNSRILSPEGRKKRIVLIDNVTGVIESSILSKKITQKSMSGRPKYGRGEQTILNRFTFFISANSANADEDIAMRSFFVNLDNSIKSKSWKSTVIDYIDNYRFHILADIIDILKNNKKEISDNNTRFPEFENDVIAPICKNITEFNDVISYTKELAESSNISIDEGHNIEDKIKSEIDNIFIDFENRMKLNPEKDNIFIRSNVFSVWFPEFSRYPIQRIKNHMKKGRIGQINLCRIKDNLNRRGLFWVADVANMQTFYILDVVGKYVKIIG